MRSIRIAVLVLLCLIPATPAAAAGVPASWDRGFNFTAWWSDHYASATAEDSLAQMMTTNPNAAAFIATWYTDDLRSSRIAPRENTPSDESLSLIIRRARAMGLRTMLRPIVDPYTGGGWRGDYEPSDPALWFSTYRTFMYHYADLAERLGVNTLSVGVELKSMTVPAYSAQWRSIIAGVRARFSGKLTYGGVYGDQVDWWDAVDYYGLSWYMSLAASRAPRDNVLAPREENLTEDQIVARWSSFTDEYGDTHDYLAWLESRYQRWHKPILFTELGYPSTKESLWAPFSSWGASRTVDMEVQARAYCAAFRALADKPWFKGVYIWQWLWNDAGIDPRTDTDQSPQNKPAEQAIQRWFSQSAGPPGGTPVPGLGAVQAARPSAPTLAGPGPAAAPAPAPAPPCRARRSKSVTSLHLHVGSDARRRGRSPRQSPTRVRAVGRVDSATRGVVTLHISRRDNFGAWTVLRVRTARVGPDGRFSLTMRLEGRGRYRVQARFGGSPEDAPSRSPSRPVRS
jgi:hypothetical protein